MGMLHHPTREAPFFACLGLHEFIYVRGSEVRNLTKLTFLRLRVSQVLRGMRYSLVLSGVDDTFAAASR